MGDSNATMQMCSLSLSQDFALGCQSTVTFCCIYLYTISLICSFTFRRKTSVFAYLNYIKFNQQDLSILSTNCTILPRYRGRHYLQTNYCDTILSFSAVTWRTRFIYTVYREPPPRTDKCMRLGHLPVVVVMATEGGRLPLHFTKYVLFTVSARSRHFPRNSDGHLGNVEIKYNSGYILKLT